MMRVFLFMGILVICVQGKIVIEVVQEVCTGGECNFESKVDQHGAAKNTEGVIQETTTISSLAAAEAELLALENQLDQVSASVNAVGNAGNATTALVTSTGGGNAGKRHRRRRQAANVNLVSCDPAVSLSGDSVTVVTAVINGILAQLGTITTSLDTAMLNCYIDRAQSLTQSFTSGSLPAIADMTAITSLANQVANSVQTASSTLNSQITQLQTAIATVQSQIAALGGSGCKEGDFWMDNCNQCWCENGESLCTELACSGNPFPACDPSNELLSNPCCYCMEGNVECNNQCLLETALPGSPCDPSNELLSNPCCTCMEGAMECDKQCLLGTPSPGSPCDASNILLLNPCCACMEGFIDCNNKCLLSTTSPNATWDSSNALASNPCCTCMEGNLDCDKQCLLGTSTPDATTNITVVG